MTEHPVDPHRHRIMSAVRGKDSKAELQVRSFLHRSGFRYRLHAGDLPGRPDIVLPKWRTVIFVHGCFWHRHPGCPKATMPATRQAFWLEKFKRNIARDVAARDSLLASGWRVAIVWECALSILRRDIELKILAVWLQSGGEPFLMTSLTPK